MNKYDQLLIIILLLLSIGKERIYGISTTVFGGKSYVLLLLYLLSTLYYISRFVWVFKVEKRVFVDSCCRHYSLNNNRTTVEISFRRFSFSLPKVQLFLSKISRTQANLYVSMGLKFKIQGYDIVTNSLELAIPRQR